MNHQIYLVYNKWTIIKLAKAKRHPVDQTQVSSAAQKNCAAFQGLNKSRQWVHPENYKTFG
jgi:hypothetical protein